MIVYDIFKGSSSGGPVDYGSAVATTSSLSMAMPALSVGTQTRFAVRARDTVTGYSDKNTDAQVLIILDAAGIDVSGRPFAPQKLRATPKANGSALVEWSYPYLDPTKVPIGFRVYLGVGSVSYASPVLTIPYGSPNAGIFFFRANLSGLTDGALYRVGVRAYSSFGEEANTTSVTLLADATGPSSVLSLVATSVL